MVAHSMELDELLFSSFFMDHGNNNELKETSSNLTVLNTKAENGGFKALFTPSNGNELNFCNGFNETTYAEVAINYRGSKTSIKAYDFYDGQGTLLFKIDKNGIHTY